MIVTPVIDTSDEEVRTYHYANGFNLNVPNPQGINPSQNAQGAWSHFVKTVDGGVYVPAGWVAYSWKSKVYEQPQDNQDYGIPF